MLYSIFWGKIVDRARIINRNIYILLYSYNYIMKSNQDYLRELEQALGDEFTDFFPDGIGQEVEKETFQSKTFQAAGFHTMPDRYGTGDRFL